MKQSETRFAVLLGVIVLFGSGACQKSESTSTWGAKAENEVGRGVLTGRTYTNEYFNLSVTVPEEWYIQSLAESSSLAEEGASMITGENQNMKAAIDAAKERTLILLSAFKHPPGTPVPVNPSIIIMAEQVKMLPGIKSGGDYLEQMKMTMNQGAMNYQFEPIESNYELGYLDSQCLPVRMKIGSQEIQQRIYASRVEDYVLAVVLSFENEETREDVENIRRNIKAGNP